MAREPAHRTRQVALEQRLLVSKKELVEIAVHFEQVEEARHVLLRAAALPIPHAAHHPPTSPTAIIGQYATAP